MSGTTRPLTPAELRGVLEAAEDPRTEALIATIAYAGLRIGEALALSWGDAYNLQRGRWRRWITVRRAVAKGGRRGRRIPLNGPLRWRLEAHRLAADTPGLSGAPLFPGRDPGRPWSRAAATRALGRTFAEAELEPEGVSSHSLRKHFATELQAGGAGLNAIRVLLGHADLRTTQRYLGTVPDAELCAAVDSLGTPERRHG